MAFVEITAVREVVFQAIFFRVFYFLLTVTVLKKFDSDLQRKLVVRYVSVFHAFVTGLGSVTSFVFFPEQLTKPDDSFNALTYHLVLFSISYFMHDTIDMIIYGEGIKYIEYIAHHVFMLACGLVVMHIPFILPVAMVALIAEVNTVFIHLRLILKFYGFGAESQAYKINQFFNIATFMPCRQLPPLWIAWFSLFYESQYINLLIRLIFISCVVFITVHNYRIFTRLLVVEGWVGHKKKPVAVCQVESDDFMDEMDVQNEDTLPPMIGPFQTCTKMD